MTPAIIDIRPVGYIIGWLILGLGGLMLVPFFVDFAVGASATPDSKLYAT